LADNLRGQLSGAVGAYNATSLIVKDPIDFEKRVCAFLGLQPSEYSNQLVEPEYLLRLLLEINVAFGIFANLADDLRNLQRTEIAEVQEQFDSRQVGSSTMPHKRNPWNSEHVKSLWKAFSPRVTSFYMDQISEHQRDLTNSASSRFIADYLAGFSAAAARLKKVLSQLHIDQERALQNLKLHADLPLSEAAYILLSVAGEPEAHEVLRTITLECEKEKKRLVDVLQTKSRIWSVLDTQLQNTVALSAGQFFASPELYRGKAAERTQTIVQHYREKMQQFKEVF
jgi:adenylosuccinate lyase